MMDKDSSKIWQLTKAQYKDIGRTIRGYFDVYGGWRTICSSPYWHISFLLTVCSYKQWTGDKWHETVTGVMPNLLGFTLAGYAVILSFGDEKFRVLISQKGTYKHSPFLGYSTTFLHFVIIQSISLIFAILYKSIDGFEISCIVRYGLSLIGYWMFMYSLCFAVASGLAIYKLGRAFEKVKSQELRHQERLESIRNAREETAHWEASAQFEQPEKTATSQEESSIE